MHRLSYVSGTGGAEACLDCRSALAGTAAGIRGREWGDAPLRFIIYGPAVNPAIRIGGNWYKAEVTVPEGGYLVVDPLAVPRSVTLVNMDGSTLDVFAKASRGGGLGSGEYIFQPASPGTHEVDWSGSFGFDLTWYEEEGEPPWSR